MDSNKLKPGDEFSFEGTYVVNPDPSVPLIVNCVVKEIQEDGTIVCDPATEEDRMKLAYVESHGQ